MLVPRTFISSEAEQKRVAEESERLHDTELEQLLDFESQ